MDLNFRGTKLSRMAVEPRKPRKFSTAKIKVHTVVRALHDVVTHVIVYLNTGVSCAIHNLNSHEAPLAPYLNHMSDCSVQCVNGTRNPE